MTDFAEKYHAAGFSIVGLNKREKTPIGAWKKYQSERATAAQIKGWLSNGYNIGLVMGAISGGIVALDFDQPGAFEEWSNAYPHLTVTAITKTGKGYHVLFKMPLVPGNKKMFWHGQHVGETRGEGGYIVVAPSIHPNSREYSWLTPPWEGLMTINSLADTGIEFEAITSATAPKKQNGNGNGHNPAYTNAAFNDELSQLATATVGTRNNQLFHSAKALGQFVAAGELAEGEVVTVLETTARSIGLGETEVRKTIQSGLVAGKSEPRIIPEPRPPMRPQPQPQPEAPDLTAPTVFFKSIPLAELMARPPKSYLVTGLLARGETAVIFGAPKSGKSFVMVDLLFAMATGRKFAQTFEITQPLTVCYCTNEGLAGIPNRFRSAAEWHNAAAADFARIRFYDNVPQLYDPTLPAYVDTFITDHNAEHPTPPDVVVIDTLRNATIGGRENESDDAVIIYAASQKITAAFNCAVIWVHHTSRANGGMKGSLTYEGFVDSMFKTNAPVQTAGAFRTFEYYAAKDSPPFETLTFTLTAANADPASTVVSWMGVCEGDAPPQNTSQRVLEFLKQHKGDRFDVKGISDGLGTKSQSVANSMLNLVNMFGVQAELLYQDRDKSSRNPFVYFIT